MVDLATVIYAALLTCPPILLSSLGMTICERAGEYNIGMEGIMLVAATSTYLVALVTGSQPLTILTGPLVGLAFGVSLTILQLRLRLDQIILGLGVILFGTGMDPYLAGFLPVAMVGNAVPTLPRLGIFANSSVAFLVNQNIFVYISLAAIPVAWFITSRTFFGLKMTAAGENPAGSDAVGVDVFKTKATCLIVSCILGGFAGGYFIYGMIGGWIVGITGGAGFLAIAIVRIGNWDVRYVGIYSIIVSALFSFQFLGQIVFGNIPSEVFQSMSYVISIVVVILTNSIGKRAGPAALGIPYKRG
jgi:simple sugar transport system permease protein